MINWIKSWIRAVVREETAKAVEAEGLTILVPVDAETAKTLRDLKPGQVFNVTNADGSVDKVTVRSAAKAKAPAKRKSKASSEKGRKP